MTSGSEKALWLDCDPGHDDAIALLLALFGHSSTVSATQLLGVSSVHGNNTGQHTFINAARLLDAYGIDAGLLWRGADAPLMREGKIDQGIHGDDGLGGVKGLGTLSDKSVQKQLYANAIAATTGATNSKNTLIPLPDPLGLVNRLVALLKERVGKGLKPMTIVATGPLTNVALLLKLAPEDLVQRGIDQIVLMGGAAGVPGNRSPLAEWNIMVDPEAARIVFSYPLPTIMAGLNVTHQALFTPRLHAQLLSFGSSTSARTPLIDTLSTAMTFFAKTYADEFGFVHGAPIHDFLAVAYVLDPTLFYAHAKPHSPPPPPTPDSQEGAAADRWPPKRYRVHVETGDGRACGCTMVDFYDQWAAAQGDDGTWGEGGKNAIVLEHVDTERLWTLFFDAVKRAQAHIASRSPDKSGAAES